MRTISDRQDWEALNKLQSEFQSDELDGLQGVVHRRLRGLGVEPQCCVLVQWFPDGGTYFLELVSNDCRVIQVDLDLDSAEHDILEVVGAFPRGGRRRVQRIDKLISELLDLL